MSKLVKKIYDWFVKKPLRTGGLAGLLFSPVSAYCIISADTSSFEIPEIFSTMLGAVSPLIAFSGAGIFAELLQTFTYEDKYHPRTRLSDFKKRRKLKAELSCFDFESLIDGEFKMSKQGVFASLVKDKHYSMPDTALNAQKMADLADKEEDPRLHMSAVLRLFKHNFYDSACIQLDKFFSLGKALPSVYSADFFMDVLANKIDLFLNPRNSFGLIYASALSALNQNFSSALFYSVFARHTAEFFDSSVKNEIFCLDALIHHALRAKNKEKVFDNLIREVKKQPILERVGETKQSVRQVSGGKFLTNTILFKDSSCLEDLISEKCMALCLRDVLPDKYGVVEPIHLSDSLIDGVFTYILRHSGGKSFMDLLKSGDGSALGDIVDCLALIHAKVPEQIVKYGKLNIPFKLRKKLTDYCLNLDRQIAKSIVKNYRPVYDSLKNAVFVYNKDAHPENWRVKEGRIIVIDSENNFLIPQQFDLANLLEYSDYLSDKQKDYAVRRYVEKFSEASSTVLNEPDFRLIYFNSVINRAISLCTAWSSKDRISMHSLRPVVISNAIHAVNRLSSEFKEYYSANKKEYDCIKRALISMRDLVDV